MKNKNYFEKKELVSDHQLYKEKKLARDNQLCKEKKLARDNQIRKEKELVSDKIYLEYLANIEDRFLLESWEECTSKRKSKHQFPKVAAVILVILLAMGSTAYATRKYGMWMSKHHSKYGKSEYTINWKAQEVDPNSLQGSFDSMKKALVEKYQQDNLTEEMPDSGAMPGYYEQTFSSTEDAIDFSGYNKWVAANWKYRPNDKVTLTLEATIGENDYTLDSLRIETSYEIDHIRLQENKELYFKGGNATPGQMGTISDDVTAKTKLTRLKSKQGDEWLIVDSSNLNGKFPYYNKCAYLFHDGALYDLYMVWNINGMDKNQIAKGKKRMDSLMNEWINAFHF